jgi:signal peptidase II
VQLNKKILISFIIILISFFLDRISKVLVINFFSENQLNEYYVNSFLNLVLVWNQGIAFGLLQLKSYLYHSVSFFIATIIVFIFYLILISNKKNEAFSYGLIIGGATGNLFDRLYFGAVPDFIDLHIGNFHWFVFNVADILITLGILLIIFFDMLKLKINTITKIHEKNK